MVILALYSSTERFGWYGTEFNCYLGVNHHAVAQVRQLPRSYKSERMELPANIFLQIGGVS